MTVEQTIDQMQVAGSAAAGADSKRTCEMGLTGGSESCGLFVSNMNPFDLTLAAQRVGQPIKAVADDAVNPLNSGRDENVRELVCYLLCHERHSLLSYPLHRDGERGCSNAFQLQYSGGVGAASPLQRGVVNQ